MPIRTQKQVMVGLDKMNGRAVRTIADAYDQGVNAPARGAVRDAKSLAGLMKAFGPGLVKRIDATALEEALVDTGVGAAGVGVVSATAKRRNVETSKRQNGK